MELTNDFSVPVPVSRAWEVLTDVELIAPCLPGAQLQEIEGDEYRGTVKVKVGPITAQYKGAAVFKEQDESNRRIVIDASGRETRGQGSASAIITVTMVDAGGRTDVSVNTDLTIKGKVAQFGRGMIADVSAKLLDQFVEALEAKLEAEPTTAGADPQVSAPSGPESVGDDATEKAKAQADASAGMATSPATGPTPGDTATEAAKGATEEPRIRKIDSEPAEPVDLLGTAGSPVAKRIVPIVVVVLILFLLGRRRSKKRRR